MRLYPADLAPLPARWPDLFGRAAPLALEIGFGGGRHLGHLSEAHPDWNVVGAEVSMAALVRAQRRLRRAEARHVRLFLGDARFLVRNAFAPASLYRAYVLFPDPWPKQRHAERRLLQADFLRLLAARLADDGALLLTTDSAPYFQQALTEAEATGLYRIEQTAPPEAALRTKYAQKWQREGKTIHHAAFHKAHMPADPFPRDVRHLAAMQHALLTGDLPALDAFEKTTHRPSDDTTVVFLRAYRALAPSDTLLFEAQVNEGALRQDVFVEVRPSTNGLYVGLSDFGQPLTTEGTAAAVAFVVGWLEERGLEVKARRM